MVVSLLLIGTGVLQRLRGARSVAEGQAARELRRLTDEKGQMLVGWANCLGPVVRAYETVMKHVQRRLRRWLCKKHKVRTGIYTGFPNEYLHQQLD